MDSWVDLCGGIVENKYHFDGDKIIQTTFKQVMNENPQSCWDFEIIPEQETEIKLENGICQHPNWGWLAVNSQNKVVAFRHRQQARRFANS